MAKAPDTKKWMREEARSWVRLEVQDWDPSLTMGFPELRDAAVDHLGRRSRDVRDLWRSTVRQIISDTLKEEMEELGWLLWKPQHSNSGWIIAHFTNPLIIEWIERTEEHEADSSKGHQRRIERLAEIRLALETAREAETG